MEFLSCWNCDVKWHSLWQAANIGIGHGVYTDVQRVEDQYLDEDLIVDYSIIIFGLLRQFRTLILCNLIQKCIALSAIRFHWAPCIYPYILHALKTCIALLSNRLDIYLYTYI